MAPQWRPWPARIQFPPCRVSVLSWWEFHPSFQSFSRGVSGFSLLALVFCLWGFNHLLVRFNSIMCGISLFFVSPRQWGIQFSPCGVLIPSLLGFCPLHEKLQFTFAVPSSLCGISILCVRGPLLVRFSPPYVGSCEVSVFSPGCHDCSAGIQAVFTKDFSWSFTMVPGQVQQCFSPCSKWFQP